MTLEDHMAAGYGHRVGLQSNTAAVADCAASMSRQDVAAELEKLQAVADRCHVSSVRAGFLRDVLAAMHG